jgi:glutamine synthetase type III
MTQRVFVFTETEKSMKNRNRTRPLMYAFRESEIKSVQSQQSSQNCYLVVNGLEVIGSFDDLVNLLGERIDIK